MRVELYLNSRWIKTFIYGDQCQSFFSGGVIYVNLERERVMHQITFISLQHRKKVTMRISNEFFPYTKLKHESGENSHFTGLESFRFLINESYWMQGRRCCTYVPMQNVKTNQLHLVFKIFHLQLLFTGREMRVPEYASQLCHALAPDVKFSWRQRKDGWNSTAEVYPVT